MKLYKGWFFASALALLAATGCQSDSTVDSSLYLTGTEEGPTDLPDGGKACDGKKVLVCHIPPGNPDNAHTICISKNAVDKHVEHHGDLVGACESEPETPPEEPPP